MCRNCWFFRDILLRFQINVYSLFFTSQISPHQHAFRQRLVNRKAGMSIISFHRVCNYSKILKPEKAQAKSILVQSTIQNILGLD